MYVFLIFLDYFVVLFVIVRSMFCARYCLCLWIVNLWLSLRVSLPFIYYLQLFFNIMVWVHYILFDDRIYFWFNTPLSTCHFNVISASAVVIHSGYWSSMNCMNCLLYKTTILQHVCNNRWYKLYVSFITLIKWSNIDLCSKYNANYLLFIISLHAVKLIKRMYLDYKWYESSRIYV